MEIFRQLCIFSCHYRFTGQSIEFRHSAQYFPYRGKTEQNIIRVWLESVKKHWQGIYGRDMESYSQILFALGSSRSIRWANGGQRNLTAARPAGTPLLMLSRQLAENKNACISRFDCGRVDFNNGWHPQLPASESRRKAACGTLADAALPCGGPGATLNAVP